MKKILLTISLVFAVMISFVTDVDAQSCGGGATCCEVGSARQCSDGRSCSSDADCFPGTCAWRPVCIGGEYNVGCSYVAGACRSGCPAGVESRNVSCYLITGGGGGGGGGGGTTPTPTPTPPPVGNRCAGITWQGVSNPLNLQVGQSASGTSYLPGQVFYTSATVSGSGSRLQVTPTFRDRTPHNFTFNALSAGSGSITVTKRFPDGFTCSHSLSYNIQAAPQPPPTANINANPGSVNYGGSTNVSWSSSNATACTTNFGANGLSGTRTINNMTANRTFDVTCTGPGGTGYDQTTVTVNSAVPTVDIVANPGTVSYNGSTVVSWSSSNATACTTNFGATGTSGSRTINNMTANRTFDVTCVGGGRTAYDQTTVVVGSSPPTVNLTANPGTVSYNGSTLLSWTSSNATSCSSNFGSVGTAGNRSVTGITSNRTFTITCTGPGGTASDNAAVSVGSAPPSVNLVANPTTVSYNGSTNLTWSSSNTTSCSSNFGGSGTSGSRTISNMTSTRTFTVNCTGPGGNISDSETVTVGAAPPPSCNCGSWTNSSCGGGGCSSTQRLQTRSCSPSACDVQTRCVSDATCGGGGGSGPTPTPPSGGGGGSGPTPTPPSGGGGGGGSTPPSVNLSADQTSISYGSSTTIRWSVSNATSCTASGSWGGSISPSNGASSTGSLTSTRTYILTCTGSGGSASDSVTVSVGSPPAPSLSISADNGNIAYGGSTTIRWSSSNTSSCEAAGGPWSGSKPTSGSQGTGSLYGTVTYTIRCTGSGGTRTASTTVNVAPPPPPTANISAASSPIPYNRSTTLTWSSTNATSCSASGAWSGGKATSGSQSTGNLTSTRTFTITCSGPGGSASDSVTVQVYPPPSVNLTANGIANNLAVVYGGDATLAWNSANTSSCSVSGGWSGGRSLNGSETVSNITASRTYSITCLGLAGVNTASDSVTITPSSPPPNVTIRSGGSTGSTTISPGGSANLDWSSSGSTSCTSSADWSGNKPTGGSATISNLSQSITNTITCSGPGGISSDGVTTNVSGNPNAPAPPTVELRANGNSNGTNINSGQGVSLSWTSTNATTCWASGGWTSSKPTGGSQTVSGITNSQSFAITCSGPGGSATDSTMVIVNGRSIPSTAPYPSVTVTTNPSDMEIDMRSSETLTANVNPSNGSVSRVEFTSLDTSIATATSPDTTSPYTSTIYGEYRGETYVRATAIMPQGPRASRLVPVEIIAIEIGSPSNGSAVGVHLDNNGDAQWNAATGRCELPGVDTTVPTGACDGPSCYPPYTTISTTFGGETFSTDVQSDGTYQPLVVPPRRDGTSYVNEIDVADDVNYVCTCPYNCILVTDPADVDDYSLNYYVTSIRDPWMQVVGGDIHSNNQDPITTAISNPVPFTCELDKRVGGECDPYSISLDDSSIPGTSGVASIGDGVIDSWGRIGTQVFNLTEDDEDKNGDGEPDGRFSQTSFVAPYQNYEYFYRLQEFGLSPDKNDFSSGSSKPSAPPVGGKSAYIRSGDLTITNSWNVTTSDGTDTDGDGNPDGVIIVFVDGDLRVEQPITVQNGAFLAFIVSGDITFAATLGDATPSDATNDVAAAGFYIANGRIDIQTLGDPNVDRFFLGEGVFVGWQGISVNRDYRSLLNNTKPVAMFQYRPDLVLNAPESFRLAKYQWNQIAP